MTVSSAFCVFSPVAHAERKEGISGSGGRVRPAAISPSTSPAVGGSGGTDIHLERDVDEPQRAFFARMLKKLEPGDRVIACTPEPDWILEDESENPDLPGRLELISDGLRERGATIPLQLSGDLHNYQRFDAKDKARRRARSER